MNDENTSGSSSELTPDTLASYLTTLPPNTTSSPHDITLKVNSADEFPTIRTALRGAPAKYVNLDLTGSTVTSIGDDAFMYCPSLASITIPDSVTSIGWGAFEGCRNLASVTFQGVISSSEFSTIAAFPGNLHSVFYETDSINGTPGTYITASPGSSPTWAKQP